MASPESEIQQTYQVLEKKKERPDSLENLTRSQINIGIKEGRFVYFRTLIKESKRRISYRNYQELANRMKKQGFQIGAVEFISDKYGRIGTYHFARAGDVPEIVDWLKNSQEVSDLEVKIRVIHGKLEEIPSTSRLEKSGLFCSPLGALSRAGLCDARAGRKVGGLLDGILGENGDIPVILRETKAKREYYIAKKDEERLEEKARARKNKVLKELGWI